MPDADLSSWSIASPAAHAQTSGIVEVFNYGRTKPGLIPLWVGEGDAATASFITAAAEKSLRDGETFYTYQRGIPELREAIASYMGRLYGRPMDVERFSVTVGGMHALQLAMRLVAEPGDEVIVLTPAWPNFVGAITVNGSHAREVELRLGAVGYELDLDAIVAAIGPRTRAICINSPANPTGWVASRDDQQHLLALARKHGLWIVADEIYGRFCYDQPLAPSFHDIMAPDDRILFVQTLSKNWAMTGWRIGWLEAPSALGQTIENLIQYSTSGVPVAHQRAAVVAITQGEPIVAAQIAQARANRDLLMQALRSDNGLTIPYPAGAFYLFFRIDGIEDSMAAAIRLVDQANVGVAPGVAFGAGGEGFMRLCYLRRTGDISAAATRLTSALGALRAR